MKNYITFCFLDEKKITPNIIMLSVY